MAWQRLVIWEVEVVEKYEKNILGMTKWQTVKCRKIFCIRVFSISVQTGISFGVMQCWNNGRKYSISQFKFSRVACYQLIRRNDR